MHKNNQNTQNIFKRHEHFHDKNVSLFLDSNIKHENQGHKHEVCKM